MVLVFHALSLLLYTNPPAFFKDHFFSSGDDQKNESAAIKVSNIDLEKLRIVGAKNGSKRNSAYLNYNPGSTSKEITTSRQKFMASGLTPAKSSPQELQKPAAQKAVTQNSPAPSKSQSHKEISLKDLSAKVAGIPFKAPKPKPVVTRATPSQRPGTRPEVGPQKKALEAISVNGSQMKKFLQGGAGPNAMALSGDDRTSGLSNSDVMVRLEVPEGVNPDELNEYELMFYGFQRRTAINYVNSFYKHLDKFVAQNPHIAFPMTDTKQVMTGRLTYDDQGNIKQIKMIRWSNEGRLQGFFEEVLKDMDTLHNPPQALWNKSGEFSIFFSFIVNG
jgi:hypothetical protein